MIRTVEATIAGIILIAVLISVFSIRPSYGVSPLPAADILAALETTGQLRGFASQNDARAIHGSITSYLPPAYSCRVEIIPGGSHGPAPESPSATASHFISFPEPREVRVTIW